MLYDGWFSIEFWPRKIRLIVHEKDNDGMGLSAVNS
jgi:hypothetical protein